jgi:uncharacterized membrane protein
VLRRAELSGLLMLVTPHSKNSYSLDQKSKIMLVLLLFGLCVHSITCTGHSSSFMSEYINLNVSGGPSLPANEFNALYDFYNSLNGEYWYWPSMSVRWNFSESNPDPCSGWYGLSCNCNLFTCNLTNMTLGTLGLNGSLPSTIGAWEKLLAFEISINVITGTIPESIGNWTDVEVLVMQTNYLRARIPISIGNLTNLQVLDLSYNLLTGFPMSLQNFPNLSVVYLQDNSFYGTFPQWIANLCCVQVLYLDNNLFSGTVSSLLSISTLYELELSSNIFTGTTDTFRNMHNVLYLSIQLNFFSGDCASDLTTISNIEALFLTQNLFTGSLPLSSSWRGLYDYYAFINYFSRTIPEDFSNITSLEYFSVGSNFMTGTMSRYFFDGQLPLLLVLNLSNNFLTGSLPTEIKSLNRLQELLVNNNFITGSVPAGFSSLPALYDLWINNNELTGTLPFSLAAFPRLEEFFAQNNYFEGCLSDLLISHPLPEYGPRLTTIDVSNNLFTGSLVGSFFSSQTSLRTFAAVNNCLKATIPVDICNLESLTYLSLDGMSTSENCRTLFFPGTIFTGFYSSHSVASTVPSCLFLLPYLESLLLSGNGFSGSIPSPLNISRSLLVLTLSNNKLTGSIPEMFQNKSWQNLELSYNKLSGTLSSSFSLIPSEASLNLEVNRLSGVIPAQLIDVQSINILNGNIFSCDSSADLPIHDPSQQTYSCGSDSVNDFLYLWVSCFVISGIVCSLVYYTKVKFSGREVEIETHAQTHAEGLSLRRRFKPLETLLGSSNTVECWRCSFISYCDQNPFGNISILRRFFESIKKGFILIGLLGVLLFLPIYAGLTVFSSTYQFEYAWSISAILLSGEFAAVVIFGNCFIILVLFVLILLYVLYDIDLASKMTDQTSTQQEQWKISFLKVFGSFVASKRYKSRERIMNGEQKHKLSCLVYLAVTVVDLVLYGFADISYVIIVITYNRAITAFAVVGLALYKFFANDFILSKSIPLMSYLFEHTFTNSTEENAPNLQFAERITYYHFTILDISFLEHIMLVNHVVLPIISVLVVLPDCFYNAFFAASPSSSSYPFVDTVETGHEDYNFTLNEQTEFTPPFFYSYQCASKVLISFVPLYIMKFCYVGFLRPLKHLFTKLGYDYCYTKYGQRSKLWKTFRYFLPKTLQNLQPEVSSRPVYQRLSITIQLSSYFAIIVVFGTLFPPLAVIGSVSVLSMIFVEELLLGRVLYDSSQAGYEWYKQRLEEDCGNIRETILLSAQSTLFVSCCFFAFLLLDTWGDKKGWKSALPIACCILIPCLLFRLYQVSQSIRISNSTERRDNTVDQEKRSLSKGHVEMGTVTTENPLQQRTALADPGEQ